MPSEKIGMNLFMCIPLDHMRDDLGNTVTPPCRGIEDLEGKFALVVNRTGRLVA